MEIELKLALHPDHHDRLRRHPILRGIHHQQRTLHSIYFDTPEFDLFRRRIALRLRRVDAYWIQTLKAESRSIGALTSRPEWEMTVADGQRPDFTALPAEVLDLLSDIDFNQVMPVFVTEFQRIIWLIGNDHAQAEVALDIGKIQAGESHRDISEVEIELKSGAPEFLFETARQLLRHNPLQIEPRSKAERGYILCGAMIPAPTKFSRPAYDKNLPANVVWHRTMQAALVHLTANVPGFLEYAHEAEYLHQLRVAVRRLLTGIAVGKSFGKAFIEFNQPLRQLMSSLNPARNWDVLQHEILPEILTALETPDDELELNEATLDRLYHTAARARQQAQAMLLRPAFTQLVLDIGCDLLSAPADDPQRTAESWARAMLESRWQKLLERGQNFANLDDTQRHQIRIAAKKLRYAIDMAASIFRKKNTDPFIALLSELQDELGYVNDRVIARQLLHTLPKRTAAIGFAFGQMSGVLKYQTLHTTHSSTTVWKKLLASKLFWR
ncbi:CYTH and CHAD domain-containing protein [Nitrosomonas sp.]|uniref:CYTH and CHAD domain-containing protein n=1 Tax=Nitrosomonas sp. TaxID=42353 RepID=UPI001DE53FFA|nr:CYTH and CHAD domain-containing protein [Nitrosomonas sp.]MBX3616800.1 CHAD domain-containing protein [Nitrosomonas sp.]